MYSVKRIFGGYSVIDNKGQTSEIFGGTGAKARAEAYADKLNGQPAQLNRLELGKPEELLGRGGRGRGGVGRGA